MVAVVPAVGMRREPSAHRPGRSAGHLDHSARATSVRHRGRATIGHAGHPICDRGNAGFDVDRQVWRSQHVAKRPRDRGHWSGTTGRLIECLATISDDHHYECRHRHHAAGNGGRGSGMDTGSADVRDGRLFERHDHWRDHSRRDNASIRIAASWKLAAGLGNMVNPIDRHRNPGCDLEPTPRQ